MTIGKLQKFKGLNTLPNVVQNFNFHDHNLIGHDGKTVELKGNWNQSFFCNDKPIVIDLACGKGEYTTGLAQLFPEKNFIGIDLKGNRLWNGAQKAYNENMRNVGFIRSRIELLPHFFECNEVSEIWITFPDPFLKKTRENKRLTAPFFLEKYRQVCKKGAIVNLKTDDQLLFEYTQKVIKEQQLTLHEQIDNIYAQKNLSEYLNIKTYYEKKHLEEGKTIKYLKFSLH